MKILSFIEDPEVIKKILKHLGLWDIKARPPPKATATPPDFQIDYSHRGVGPMGRRQILRSRPVRIIFTRLNFPKGTLFNWVYSDPEYPIEAYVS